MAGDFTTETGCTISVRAPSSPETGEYEHAFLRLAMADPKDERPAVEVRLTRLELATLVFNLWDARELMEYREDD